jgi:transmembrane sensor
MEKGELYDIIGKVLAGQANEEEVSRFKAWQHSTFQNQLDFEVLRKVWEKTRIQRDESTDIPFQKVLSRINNGTIYPGRKLQRKGFFGKYYWAAAIALLLVSFFAVLRFNTHPIGTEPVATEVKLVQKINPPGQKSRVHLPDGSSVWLNAESTLQFPQKFDSLSRTVLLSGEAFFEVARDPKRPFMVRTGELTTTAIGTSFNIKAFEDQNFILVALASGKIKVESKEGNILLSDAGNCIIYDKVDQQLKAAGHDIFAITGWKDGVLVFREANFDTIIQELERWYGVTIHVVNKPRQEITFTGKFANEYLSNVLERVSFGRPFTYSIEDKIVTIKF